MINFVSFGTISSKYLLLNLLRAIGRARAIFYRNASLCESFGRRRSGNSGFRVVSSGDEQERGSCMAVVGQRGPYARTW